MKKYLSFVFLIALFACTPALADIKLQAMYAALFNTDGSFSTQLTEDLCKFEEADLNKYSGEEWVGADPSEIGHYKYLFSFCEEGQEAQCKEKKGSLCQYDLNNDSVFTNSLASFSAAPAPVLSYIDADKKEGLQLTFSNGEECFVDQKTKDRIVQVNFVCDNGVSVREFSIVENPTCHYTVDIKHKLACANSEDDDDSTSASSLSGGAWFLIIVLIVAVIYVIAGCLVCTFAFGKPFGPQACPHNAFWCALPGLFVAGCGFSLGKIKSCFGGKTITTTTGEYEQA